MCKSILELYAMMVCSPTSTYSLYVSLDKIIFFCKYKGKFKPIQGGQTEIQFHHFFLNEET